MRLFTTSICPFRDSGMNGSGLRAWRPRGSAAAACRGAVADLRACGGRRLIRARSAAGRAAVLRGQDKGRGRAVLRTLARARKPYRQVDKAELTRVAGTPLHGGLVAIAGPQPLAEFDETRSVWAKNGKPLLVLDGIGNPHNLGAIARSAAFFGLERMVLADRPEQALPSGCQLPRGGRRTGASEFASRPAPGRPLRYAGRSIA